MSQLWQLGKIAGINTQGSLSRRDMTIFSATGLYIESRLDNVFTLRAFQKAVEERRTLLAPLIETLGQTEESSDT